eukprot:CAMPEP_0170439834 /NCGR_PEP_ID=MMETSP0117_2-20130122/46000_1 /TAXON_ID=400756 /ORGANISM="Durinskia baltica, Strain CSIRO CS-38" /LENGTH=132 /DNA_ID=CAMNT_0010700191 /DNA_START=117 /DNA_END=512 /DNA_ORIENTATION=+
MVSRLPILLAPTEAEATLVAQHVRVVVSCDADLHEAALDKQVLADLLPVRRVHAALDVGKELLHRLARHDLQGPEHLRVVLSRWPMVAVLDELRRARWIAAHVIPDPASEHDSVGVRLDDPVEMAPDLPLLH